MDTTVQEKNITFPTDAKLYNKACQQQVGVAHELKLKLPQAYDKVCADLMPKIGQYGHAKQYKRMKKAINYDEGERRWHPRLAALAEEYDVRPKVCRPYRAKTKGKVERFNRYLKESFVTLLAATLKSAGLPLDVVTADAHIGPWLEEIAQQRIHGTTGVKPALRLAEESLQLLPLPARSTVPASAPPLRPGQTLRCESLQPPLSAYDQLLEGVA